MIISIGFAVGAFLIAALATILTMSFVLPDFVHFPQPRFFPVIVVISIGTTAAIVVYVTLSRLLTKRSRTEQQTKQDLA